MVEKEGMSNKIIVVSGGFDPLHIGHVQMIQHAATYGKVFVVINTDEWLIRKKGYAFMPYKERAAILESMSDVEEVWGMRAFRKSDDDGTVIAALNSIKPDYFANGGDRTKKNVPEQAICDELDIEMLWGIGGEDKPQSSSELVKRAMEQLDANTH
jgi:D-beta-D-heptose 7-phosphate kinase/D-beta-D-heptose 1-phosphate adenosyltransferase